MVNSGIYMRALSVKPKDEKTGVYPENRYTIYNNVTLADVYVLNPPGTSCIMRDYKLYDDL